MQHAYFSYFEMLMINSLNKNTVWINESFEIMIANSYLLYEDMKETVFSKKMFK